MKKIFNLQNLYVLLWALYYTQGLMITQGGIFSRTILLLFLSISLYYVFFTYLKKRSNSYFNALGCLLIMFTVYGIYGIMSGVSFDYLKLIYLSLLPTYPLYIWSQQGKISTKWIRIVSLCMVGVVAAQYIITTNYIEEMYMDLEYNVINIAYEVLALFPLVFFWKRTPTIQYIMVALILAVVLTTLKRGAIILGVLCTIYFIITINKETSKRKRWYIWLLMILFVVIGSRYAISFYENNAFAQLRLEKTMSGDSSGRDFIYLGAWNIFKTSGLFNMIFGHGAMAEFRFIGHSAHNDWLEILVSQGIVGVVLYIIYWGAFYKTMKRNTNNDVKPLLGMVFIIYFVTTFFSMSYSAMTLPANLALAYGLSMCGTNNRIN